MSEEQITARLVRGIVAFDTIIQDILYDVENGKEPHEMALWIMDTLAAQLLISPNIQQPTDEFIKIMADLGGRIRLHAICADIDNEKLLYAIGKIRERLRELGPRNIYSMGEVDTHFMN